MANSRRVLVVYPYLPHYRYGVFTELGRSVTTQYLYAADRVERTGSIKSLSADDVPRLSLRNRYLARVLWQSGLIPNLIRHRYHAVIFLADVTYLSTWVAASLLRLRGTPVLFWTIGWHRPEGGVKRLARLSFYRLADQLLLYGRSERDIGEELGYPPDRMTVIGNSVESPPPSTRGELAPALPRIEEGALVIGAVIRLNRVKNLHLVIEAAAILRARRHDVRVLLVGEGPDRERLARLAEERRVPVHMPGPVYGHPGLSAVYDRLDITVVPSAVGLTAVQSLSFGVPVISDDDRLSQMPEWDSIIPGVTGEVFRSADARSLADAVEKVRLRCVQSPAQTASDCLAEVDRRWTAASQAASIERAVTTVTDRRRSSAAPVDGRSA